MTTPGNAMRQGFPWIPVVAVVMVILGIIAWVTQGFGFWLDTNSAKHDIKIQQLQQQGPQYHDGWETKLSNDYKSMLDDQATEGQVPASDLPTVKTAVLGDAQSVCYDYTKANVPGATQDTPPDITSWYQANCSGSAVSLTSGLRK